MKRSLILALFSTACIIAYGANKSVIKNNVNGGDAETKFISEECCVKSEEVYKNFAEAAKWGRLLNKGTRMRNAIWACIIFRKSATM